MSEDKLKEKLRKRQEALKKGSGSYDYFVIKEGTTRMRPLPAPKNKDWAVEIIHFYLGGEIKGLISAQSFGERCAVYEYWEKLKKSKKESDQKLADKIKPKQKYMAAHIKYNDDKGKDIDRKAGAKLLLLHKGMYQTLLDFYLDDEKGDFTSAKLGYDIKYKRQGTGQMDTEYTVLDCKPSRLDPEFASERYDPEAMAKELTKSYDESLEILEKFLKSEKKKPQGEDGDDEERPRKKKKKSDA
jgi:hypothetical protein